MKMYEINNHMEMFLQTLDLLYTHFKEYIPPSHNIPGSHDIIL